MTDTYIYQKVRARFLAIDAQIEDEEGNKTDLIAKEFGDEGEVIRYTNVQEPNVAFTRPSDGFWFEIFPLHSQPFQKELGTVGRNRWNFGLQVNICYPKDGGTYDIDAAYDAIAAAFRRGDIFDGVRVLNTAYRSSARLADDYYSVPVTIMVQADLDN